MSVWILFKICKLSELIFSLDFEIYELKELVVALIFKVSTMSTLQIKPIEHKIILVFPKVNYFGRFFDLNSKFVSDDFTNDVSGLNLMFN